MPRQSEHQQNIWDEALDAVATETRHARTHRLGIWRTPRCDRRARPVANSPPRQRMHLLPGRYNGLLIGITEFPPGSPPNTEPPAIQLGCGAWITPFTVTRPPRPGCPWKGSE